ncbi:MAG: UDP-N-acetylmuramate dehydrogenase [Oscillospiraceae bacterium]|jgi:UDP-N-acetylmuramate dehydrogenase|nr:UDP-N-acetylmuramate dehydrogenase [Oscillospiraceae bacterium]
MLADALAEIEKSGAEILRSEPLSRHTSFRIGGAVTAMIFPRSTKQLAGITRIIRERGAPSLVLGRGTNILADDRPHELIAVSTAKIAEELAFVGGGTVHASCGAPLSRVAAYAAEHGLGGLEFAQGIPGSLGGAVYMNAGAYGGELSAAVGSVRAVTPGGETRELSAAECRFAYRSSLFADGGYTILSADIKLAAADRDEIAMRMRDFARRRRESQPLEQASAGSAFKRPKDGYAAALIDGCGLRGFRVGDAMVSEKHAGFVVNAGAATFADVIAVINHVRETVLREKGVALEPEVMIIDS